ncbi:MAG: CDP-alcohol phosphatidyltransferase family protein [Patescibacteria group bacterium]
MKTESSFEVKYYYKFAERRDNFFRPLFKLFSVLHLTPDMLSFSGVAMMVLFALFLKINILASLIFLFLTFIFDMLDGGLARYQGAGTDKGKFKDMFCDNLNFSIFIIGLVYAGLLNGSIGIIYVYLMLLSRLFRSIKNSFIFKSDWFFKAMAGFWPAFYADISYFIFLIYFLFNKNYFNLSSVIISILLSMDVLIYFKRILKQKAQ